MQKSIRDTYVYKVLGIEDAVKQCSVVNSDLSQYVINSEIVDAIVNEFKFKINFPNKNRIIDEIKAGRIVFVDTSTVTALPTWMITEDGRTIKTAVVNLFGKLKQREDGTAQFNAREIFSLAVIALTVREFYQKEQRILSSNDIIRLSTVVYERMMYRVLDTLYSLDIAPDWVRMTVRISLRVFAASYLMEKRFVSKDDYDSIYNFIFKDLMKFADPNMTSVQTFISKFPSGSFVSKEELASLPVFIESLQKMHPLLKDLDITTFLRKFIMMYGEKALLMIENYQYFLAYVFSVTLNGNIVKDFALEGSVGKEGILLYNAYFDVAK